MPLLAWSLGYLLLSIDKSVRNITDEEKSDSKETAARFYYYGLIFWFILGIILCSAECRAETVTRVVDGDPFYVDTGAKIRLYGIDCPESDQRYGDEAAAFIKRLCLGKTVRLSCLYNDQCGRKICKVRLSDGSDLNRLLLENGLAWVYSRYCRSRSYYVLDWYETE